FVQPMREKHSSLQPVTMAAARCHYVIAAPLPLYKLCWKEDARRKTSRTQEQQQQ
ncbi:MAG: hypothetical protein GY800_04660, partial [Planctomycetes bacterium]|nr:hypothetical protein [Planctomycetota bacterium]